MKVEFDNLRSVGHRKDMLTHTVPGLGVFSAMASSSCATFQIIVEFWPESAEGPLIGSKRFEPIFDEHTGYTVTPDRMSATHSWVVWPKAAEDVAYTLAQTVFLYDPVGFIWLMLEMCQRDIGRHRRDLDHAQNLVKMLEGLVASDPAAPIMVPSRDPVTRAYREVALTPDEAVERRAMWARNLAQDQRKVAKLQAPDVLRAVARKKAALEVMRRLFFKAPNKPMEKREIVQAILVTLTGGEM